jgi:hypothetical protein
VDCPVCFCNVPLATINTHLDTACTSRQNPPRKKQRLIAAGTSTQSTTPKDGRSNALCSINVVTSPMMLAEAASADQSALLAIAEVGQKGLPTVTVRTAEGFNEKPSKEGQFKETLSHERPGDLSVGVSQPEATSAPRSGPGTSQKELAPESTVVSHDTAQQSRNVEGGRDDAAASLQGPWWTARAQRHHQPAALWQKARSRSTVPLTSQQLQVKS